MSNETEPDVTVVPLRGKLLVGDMPGLKLRLTNVLAAKKPVELDGKTIDGADASALQLLAAFVAHARAMDQWHGWSHVSDELRFVGDTLGLSLAAGLVEPEPPMEGEK